MFVREYQTHDDQLRRNTKETDGVPVRAPATKECAGPLNEEFPQHTGSRASHGRGLSGDAQRVANARQRRGGRLQCGGLGEYAAASLRRHSRTRTTPRKPRCGSSTRLKIPSSIPTARRRPTGRAVALTAVWKCRLDLSNLHATGGPDGVKAVAFARVDQTDVSQVDAALAIFGGLWLGITVLDANQQQFLAGEAWTDVAGSPIDGGHAILSGGYTPDIKFITWAPRDRVRTLVLERLGARYAARSRGLGCHLARAPRLGGIHAGRESHPARADYLSLTGTVLTLPSTV